MSESKLVEIDISCSVSALIDNDREMISLDGGKTGEGWYYNIFLYKDEIEKLIPIFQDFLKKSDEI